MILSTRQLSIKHKNATAIHFPDLELESGEKLLVRGPSGCGKTSWIYALCGILPLHNGQVMVGKTDFSGLPQSKKDAFRVQHFGIIFQEARLLPSLTVRENIQLATRFHSSSKILFTLEDILAKLGLEKVGSQKPGQLSTGEKQRTSIARTLMQSPAFILADEPTSALDDKHTHDVINLLIQSALSIDAGLIVVTHDQRLDSYFNRKMDWV